jgi:hypothetical protein
MQQHEAGNGEKMGKAGAAEFPVLGISVSAAAADDIDGNADNPETTRRSEYPGLKTYFTPEENRINGSKGGKASVIAKRRQKTFRESIKAIMSTTTPDEEKRQRLEALGLDATVLNAINLAVSGKAAQGDVEAARYLRDTAGEKPKDGLEIGNLDDKPLASLDMTKLTDEQLRIIAARRTDNEEDEVLQ